jgi:hypothetical protein
MVWEENCARIIDRNGFGIITLTPVLGSTWEFDEVYQKWQNGNKSYECWVGSTDENEILDSSVIEEIFGDLSDPVMRDIEAFLSHSQKQVSGSVFVQLNPYRFQVTGIESPYDLMNSRFGKYGEMNAGFTGDDVRGFSRIAGQQTHDVRAERAIGGVFVQKEEVSAATCGELGQSLFGERGLAGASVTSEKNESGWVHGRDVFKLTV